MPDNHVLHLAIRWLHVGAMAVAFGGAVVVLTLAVRSARGVVSAATLAQAATSYEWTFWAAAGVLAMTGIGNLGALGVGLPEPATAWGTTLELKLASVLVLVLLSLPRTLAVASLTATGQLAGPTGPATARPVQALYAATTGIFAALLAIAVTLAHG